MRRRAARKEEARTAWLDTRGAVMVEFLAAFLPLFIMFECLVQLAGLITAKLVVDHAAATAARAAVVVLSDNPKYYNDVKVDEATGKRRQDIESAAAIPLMAVKSVIHVKVTLPSSPGGDDDRTQFGRNDMVNVKVQAIYLCQVPFAKRVVCNMFTETRTLTGEASLPNNGADYVYSDD